MFRFVAIWRLCLSAAAQTVSPEHSANSTRIFSRLDVIAGTGKFDGARGEGEVRARCGGPVGSAQLTSIRLRLHSKSFNVPALRQQIFRKSGRCLLIDSAGVREHDLAGT